MKKHIVTLFGFALLLAAASAHAQIVKSLQVTVPFQFVTAGRTMPADDYRVQVHQDTGLVVLISEGGKSAIEITNKDYRPGQVGKASLLFQRYGDSWLLQEVTVGGMAQVMIRGKIEQQLAQLKPSGQQTLFASNMGGH